MVQGSIWPVHPTVKLTGQMFQYIWRHFHITFESEEQGAAQPAAQEEIESDDERDEDAFVDVNEEEDAPIDDGWFAKAAPLVEHVNTVLQRICWHPGFALSIDEMMRLFKGRSIQTHRMKHKPIKEGFKFFAICCAQSGYVYSFFPDGRKEKNTILDSIQKLIETVLVMINWSMSLLLTTISLFHQC